MTEKFGKQWDTDKTACYETHVWFQEPTVEERTDSQKLSYVFMLGLTYSLNNKEIGKADRLGLPSLAM